MKVPPLQLSFKMPLETCAFHEEQGTGPYEPMQDGDLLTYAASFIDNLLQTIPPQVPLKYTCAWQELDFFTPKELDMTLFAQDFEVEDGELAGEEELSTIRSATASTQQASSAAGSKFMLGEQEPPGPLYRAPMKDFQWECK